MKKNLEQMQAAMKAGKLKAGTGTAAALLDETAPLAEPELAPEHPRFKEWADNYHLGSDGDEPLTESERIVAEEAFHAGRQSIRDEQMEAIERAEFEHQVAKGITATRLGNGAVKVHCPPCKQHHVVPEARVAQTPWQMPCGNVLYPNTQVPEY